MTSLIATALPPLTERQVMVLEATDDRSSTIDAAGLYVLLEHVRDWPTDPRKLEPGNRLIDPQAVIASPEDWRGESFIIEGTLETIANASLYTHKRVLTHAEWGSLTCWHVRGPDDEIYVVCLTDPPDVAIGQTVGDHRKPLHEAMPVRIVGRFYKLVVVKDQAGETRPYPVFVGRTARVMQPPETPTAPAQVSGTAAVVLLITLIAMAYIVIRMSLKRRATLDASPRERIIREQKQRDDVDDEPIEYRTDLPEDPAEAMAALERERELSPDEDDTDTPQENDRWPK